MSKKPFKFLPEMEITLNCPFTSLVINIPSPKWFGSCTMYMYADLIVRNELSWSYKQAVSIVNSRMVWSNELGMFISSTSYQTLVGVVSKPFWARDVNNYRSHIKGQLIVTSHLYFKYILYRSWYHCQCHMSTNIRGSIVVYPIC